MSVSRVYKVIGARDVLRYTLNIVLIGYGVLTWGGYIDPYAWLWMLVLALFLFTFDLSLQLDKIWERTG